MCLTVSLFLKKKSDDTFFLLMYITMISANIVNNDVKLQRHMENNDLYA